MRRLLAVIVWSALTVGMPLQAQAHADMVDSDPNQGQKLDSLPPEVTLTLNENVAEPAYVAVTSPDGTQIKGDVSIEGRSVTADLGRSEAPGTYTVAYRLISADAHPITGSIEFDVTAGPDPAPSTASPSAASDAPATATPISDGASNSLSAVVVIGFFFAALAIIYALIHTGMRAAESDED